MFGEVQVVYSSSLLDTYVATFLGSLVSCILCGIYLVIAGVNLYLLHAKRYKILFSYTIVQLVLTILYFVLSIYIEPEQCLAIFGIGNFYGPYTLSPLPVLISDIMFVLNTWASDGFLLYRCYIVCMGITYPLVALVLLYLVTFGASIALVVASSIPGANFNTHAVQVTGLCYWSCSAALNVFASTLISVRFWMHRRAMMRAMDPGFKKDTFYLGYMAMTLESALFYTAFVLIALVVFVLNSPLEAVFFPMLGLIQVIAPSLIVYRIARGISLERELGTKATGSLRFAVSLCDRPQPGMLSTQSNSEFVGGLGGTVGALSSEEVRSGTLSEHERDGQGV